MVLVLTVLSIITGAAGVGSLLLGMNSALGRQGRVSINGFLAITSRATGALFIIAGTATLAFSVLVFGLLR